MYYFLSAPISSNEFDYVTFRRKAECVRSVVRCALSESSKIARIRTSEARARGPSTEGAPRRGAEHIILSYTPVAPPSNLDQVI